MDIRQATVFGGSGFVGRYIVQALARKGIAVRVAVRRPAGADFLKTHGEVGQIVPLQTNLRNRASVERAIAGTDAVINAAGITRQSGRQRYASVNVEGVRAIAEACAANGIARVAHISGIGVDGGESHNALSRSKAEAEAILRQAVPSAVILRPSVVFGPEDQFFNKLAMMARLAPFMPVFGHGKTKLQPVYVGDVAAAAATAVLDGRHAGKIFELGGPRVFTYRQISELVLAQMNRSRPLIGIPFAMLKLAGLAGNFLPFVPITYDQACLLESDNVVGAGAAGLADLGIAATSVEMILPQYMDRFRLGGRYTASPAS